MTIYFSSNQIPTLQNFSVRQRHTIITLAEKKLTAPEKLLINLLKLAILVPMFLYIVWLKGWLIAIPIIIALLAYLIIFRPVFLFLLSKHLDKAIENINHLS